ncbi:MAG TPA: DUF2520 domain-containing protein [Bacteroidia bacterium]|jgi:predicted short-subunit dehydrogenase-like oxidoreductase (DUF2520 family)|nr:DUF2520 domain-containing protein [Bacteroidia bacterium]
MKKTSLQKIVFIGSGNVATSLSESLKKNHEIIQVYSRTLANASKLGKKLHCSFTDDLKKISQDADLYIIAVKDDAIAEVCKKLSLPDKMVIHTSGSTALNVLKQVSDKYGVLWPMYSFAGKAKLASAIPFFMESSDKKTEKELTGLVNGLKGKPYYLDSEKRAIVHMTAVFVNNFPNHLFTIAEALCNEAGIPFNLFLPLAKETVENISKQSPALSQTGPASRNEKNIIKKQMALLKSHPDYRVIYKLLTKSIIKTSSGRKKL